MSDEVWKVIEDYPYYSVSNMGRVRRDKSGSGTYSGRVIKSHPDWRGYHLVYLCWDGNQRGVSLHRLVCTAFHGRPEGDKTQVDHIDFDISNNRADNLEWVSCLENFRRRKAAGRSAKGEAHPSAKITESQAMEIKRRCADGEKYSVVAPDYGISPWTASQIAKGQLWKHLGITERTDGE